MAVPASRLSRLADKAREHADEIEAVALNTTGPAIKTAPATQKDDSFDVWSHTVAGADGASKERPLDAWKAVAESPSRELARADSDAVGASIEQQADDALKKFQLLTGQRKPEPGEEDPQGFLGGLGATFDILTSLEQMISAPLAMIPFPAFPALRVMDMDIGLPHGHSHPPNLVPPAPMVFLPSTGPIIPIPFLSGATRTLINGLPAGRCGDMGLGVWCGGYFPMYEVFLGSSSVWIEGARAGRLLVDVTRHCIFSAPKPQDPPLGPMVGMTITASPNVLIGGVPMPSLLDLAMGKAIEGLFKGIGKAVKRAKAARAASKADELALASSRSADGPSVGAYKGGRPTEAENWLRLVNAKFIEGDRILEMAGAARRRMNAAQKKVDDILGSGRIEIKTNDPELERMVKQDLYQMAANPFGEEILDRISRQRRFKHTIEPKRGADGVARTKSDEVFWDHANSRPGRGAGSEVTYDPTISEGPDCPPDVTLFHEMVHAANGADGVIRSHRIEMVNGKRTYRPVAPDPEPPFSSPGMTEAERFDEARFRYTNLEEQNVINDYENPYRDQYNLRPRWGHRNMALLPGS